DQGPVIQQTNMQMAGGRTATDETPEYQIQLEVPSLERVTRRESDLNLQERIRQENKNRPSADRIEFPSEPPLSTDTYTTRVFPPMTRAVEPNYVCYDRMYFEERNSERFGWDLGIIQPLVSAGIFFFDVAALPYHVGTDPCRKYECSAGYCL